MSMQLTRKGNGKGKAPGNRIVILLKKAGCKVKLGHLMHCSIALYVWYCSVENFMEYIMHDTYVYIM